MDIVKVELFDGQVKLLTEAFVEFSNSNDVEKSLNLGKKVIGEIPIKIHRSSQEQLRFHYNSVLNQWLDITPNNRKNDIGKMAGSPNTVSNANYSIVTRGFPWATSKSEIKNFFNSVRIINGEQGIQQMVKNSVIEANFMVNNEAEAQKALALNGKKFESRRIYGIAIKR